MSWGGAGFFVCGAFAHRDQSTELETDDEIEADDMPALEAKVPEGWQLLAVRAA